MKTFNLFFLLIFLVSCQAQNDRGKPNKNIIRELPSELANQDSLDIYGLRENSWQISSILGHTDSVEQEIQLYKVDTTEMYSTYGNIMQFGKNQTFADSFSAPCGNDCFPGSTGQYFLTEENYIFLQVQNISQFGMCDEFDKDLHGPFVQYYMYYADETLRLILSNGDKEQDQKFMTYVVEVDSLSIQLDHQKLKQILDYQPKARDPQKRIEEYLKNKTQIKNFELVYRKQTAINTWVNVVKDLDTDQTLFIINNDSQDFDFQMGQMPMQ